MCFRSVFQVGEREFLEIFPEPDQVPGLFLARGGEILGGRLHPRFGQECVLPLLEDLVVPTVHRLGVLAEPIGKLLVLQDLVLAGGVVHHLQESSTHGIERLPARGVPGEAELHLAFGILADVDVAVVDHPEDLRRGQRIPGADFLQTVQDIVGGRQVALHRNVVEPADPVEVHPGQTLAQALEFQAPEEPCAHEQQEGGQ